MPRSLQVTEFLAAAELPPYDPAIYADDGVDVVNSVSALGATMGGWTPELAWRMSLHRLNDTVVDWAIMMNAYREEGGASGPRRKVERIDICHSEVHVHRFRMSDDPNDDLGERTKLISLHQGDEFTVDIQWDNQMELISHEWQQRLRRWIDG